MTTDRELLEAAAKAAGINLRAMIIKPAPPDEGDGFIGYMVVDPENWPRGWFDPLSSDGDALRLAVALDLQIYPDETDYSVAACGDDAYACEKNSPDKLAAVRRAIVRAAAAIGAAK